MAIRQIELRHWKTFLDDFSRHFKDRCVSVYAMSDEFGTHALGRGRPLMGLSMELEKDADTPAAIEVLVDGAECLRHVISCPCKLWVEQPEPGEDAALRIDAADGSAVLIDFRTDGAASGNISDLELGVGRLNAENRTSCEI